MITVYIFTVILRITLIIAIVFTRWDAIKKSTMSFSDFLLMLFLTFCPVLNTILLAFDVYLFARYGFDNTAKKHNNEL